MDSTVSDESVVGVTQGVSCSVSCWICRKYAAPTLKAVIRHIGAVHAHDPNFHICCGINGCSRVYTVFHSFRRHFYRKHRHVETLETLGNLSITDEAHFDNDYTEESNVALMSDPSPMDMKRQAALFLLKAKEIHKVSQTALDGLIPDLTILFNQYYHSEVKCKFPDLVNESESQEDFDPFQGLHSKYLQEKYFKETLHIVVCLVLDMTCMEWYLL